MKAVRTSPGCYGVEIDGRNERVYVAGTPGDRWLFWNGRAFRERDLAPEADTPGQRSARADAAGSQALSAPMPATVVKVLVAPGDRVKKGETVVILEAMKMELPLRSSADATVTSVLCKPGELVQADAVLVHLS